MDNTNTRVIALGHTAQIHAHRDSDDRAITRTATHLYQWLIGPAHLHLHVGPIRDADGQIITQPKGQPVQLRITDSEGRPYECDLTVSVYDAVGNEISDDPNVTTDDLTWALDSGDGVVSLAVSGDTRTCTVTATSLGSAVVRVTLGDLSGTVAFDVIPGDAASLTIVETEPRTRPDAEPAPEPTPEPGV